MNKEIITKIKGVFSPIDTSLGYDVREIIITENENGLSFRTQYINARKNYSLDLPRFKPMKFFKIDKKIKYKNQFLEYIGYNNYDQPTLI